MHGHNSFVVDSFICSMLPTDMLHALPTKLKWLQDNGKPYAVAVSADIPAAASHFRYYAGWADKIQGKTIPVPPTPFGNFQAYTLHEPIGVCGLITRASSPSHETSARFRPMLASLNSDLLVQHTYQGIELQPWMQPSACKLA